MDHIGSGRNSDVDCSLFLNGGVEVLPLISLRVQGYLAHKNPPPPLDYRTALDIVLLQGPGGGGTFLCVRYSSTFFLHSFSGDEVELDPNAVLGRSQGPTVRPISLFATSRMSGGKASISWCRPKKTDPIPIQSCSCRLLYAALGNLAFNNDDAKTVVAGEGGIEMVVAGMGRHRSIAGEQQEGCWSIANLP